MKADLNCDMGESFGLYAFGADEAIMPFITQANVACGFHASDPNHMAETVRLAKRHGVRVGAHVSLPDLPGFGRREMKIDGDEMENIIVYHHYLNNTVDTAAACANAGCDIEIAGDAQQLKNPVYFSLGEGIFQAGFCA